MSFRHASKELGSFKSFFSSSLPVLGTYVIILCSEYSCNFYNMSHLNLSFKDGSVF